MIVLNTNIPIKIITIENDGCHILVVVKINGKKANLLIDTGASRTVFDNTKIKKFIPKDHKVFKDNEKLSTGIGTNKLESQVTVLKKLELGDIIVKNYNAIVLDMKHVIQSYSSLKLPVIDGILGGDLLAHYKAVINYKDKILKLTA